MFRSHFLSLTSKTFITLLQAPVRMIFTLEDTGYAFNLPTCHLLSGIFIYEETDEEGGIFSFKGQEKKVFSHYFSSENQQIAYCACQLLEVYAGLSC